MQNGAVPCTFEFDRVIDDDIPRTRRQDNAVKDEAGKTYHAPWCPSDICDRLVPSSVIYPTPLQRSSNISPPIFTNPVLVGYSLIVRKCAPSTAVRFRFCPPQKRVL